MRGDAGGVRAGGPLPELDVANYSSNGWKEWLVLFRRHVGPSFNNFSNPKKVSTLLAKLGPNARHIFESFDVGDHVLFSDLLSLFKEYFSTVKGRVAFYKRTQRAEEDFVHFANALTALSSVCGFGPCQDAVVRDVFVTNLHHRYGELRDNLLKLNDPTMDELILTCKALDSSTESPLDAKSGCRTSENIVADSEVKCNGNDLQRFQATEDKTHEKITDVDRLSSQALKDISNRTDSYGGSDIKNQTPKNGAHDLETADSTASIEESGKLNAAGKIEKSEVANDFKRIGQQELPNLFRRKTSDGSSVASRNAVSNLGNDSDKNPQKSSNLPKTSVNSRLSKFSKTSQDRQSLPKIGKKESAKIDTAENENSFMNSAPTSLTQFMKKCQEISVSNSANAEGKSKFLSSGTVTSCKIDGSPEDSSRSVGNYSSEKCQSPSITSSAEETAPIPSSCFTEITVVYIPEEGERVYVCPSLRIPFMQNLEADLKSRAGVLEKVDIPACGRTYAAPWGDDWYRGRVVDKTGDVVKVVFCDYGNEENVLSSELKRLPQEYEDEVPLAFPVRPPTTCSDIVFGGQLRVKPVRFTAGAWDIEVDTSGKTDS